MPGVEFIPGVPTQLNTMLATAEIDFGPISSIAYARIHRCLLLSSHVSISSLGAVESIQLVSRKPLAKVRKVALTQQSATAVVMLKVLMKLRYEQEVEYQKLEGSPEDALKTCDAVLLIGDEGLDACHASVKGVSCHDLGEVWQDWTGLPMVYAVWAARESFARTRGSDLRAVEQELVECLDYGREHLSDVVKAAAERYSLDREDLSRYFSLLRYDFTDGYRRGLMRLYELAYEAGELEEIPDLRFIDEYALDVPAVLFAVNPGDAIPENLWGDEAASDYGGADGATDDAGLSDGEDDS